MTGNLIVLLILVGVIIFFVFLAWRAWHAKNAVVKWVGVIFAALLTLLFAYIAFIYGKGMLDMYGPRPVAPVNISVAATPEQVARGEHLASVLCASCHSTNGSLPLSGGNDFANDSPLPIGMIIPPNITTGGRLAKLTDNDVMRILRTGVDPNGRLTMMAAFPVRNLSDEDALALIAYLRNAPAVQNETLPVAASPLLVFMIGAGALQVNVPATIQPVVAPPKAATLEYGKYITNFMDCTGCHGPTLSADGGPLMPPGSSNLTQIVPKWSKDDFFQAMRTGVDRDGHQISTIMPWKNIGKLEDVELEAMYLYLNSLKPIASPK